MASKVSVSYQTIKTKVYLTAILTVLGVRFLPLTVTVTLTTHTPFFKVLIAVPRTLQIFFEDAATLSTYFEPVGAFSLARLSSFDFTTDLPAFTEYKATTADDVALPDV